jgi:hypothetical protein
MTLRERVWRLVPAVFFTNAFNKPLISASSRIAASAYAPACTRGQSPSELNCGLVSRKGGWLSRAVVLLCSANTTHPGAMDLVYAVL